MVAMRTMSPLKELKRITRETQKNLEALANNTQDNTPALTKLKTHRKRYRRNFQEITTFKSYHEFLGDVRGMATGKRDSIEKMHKYQEEMKTKAFPSGLNETVLADGGALIPPQWQNELLMRVYDNDLLSRVRMFNQMSSNILRIPAINETSRVDGSRFGGIRSYWRQEAGSMTASKPGFKTVDLKVESLFVFARMTNELLEDLPAAETYLGEVVSEEFKFKIGDSIFNGDGVGKMEGLMNSGSKIAIAKDIGQLANTITVNNILNMWKRLWTGCKKNAVWLVHNTLYPELMKLVIGQFPIFLPQNTIAGVPYATMLGRPVIETEFNQELGTEGDIMLSDLGTYLAASKGDMRTFTSMHIYFDTGEQAFRFEMRLDGKSWWQKALTPKNGTTTVSNIVTVATRA